ncbi:MAG: hypothetical protein A2W31_17415 [Planctomycetes bacterium RBG_16_64_10]|nr:MAG: hypothetical protein A2W31_17415 [Planctomycetes bacterium RBG_16_64_10]
MLIPAVAQDAGNQPPRLARADSFLGIHFDFHAGDDCTEIGKHVTPEMIEQIIDAVHPDYIQCDCKGHRGLCSYPTKVGNPAPGFIRDQLRIWREVTAQRGVALYMHYSGVWDTEVCKKHSEWARVDENGKPDPDKTSVFGPYADRLLIPQLRELANEYGADGVWVDGECWATVRDYGEAVLKRFRDTTGIAAVPKKPEDQYWFEFSEFCREGFRSYLNHYVTELHRTNPNFQVASNWAFTSLMPGQVTAPVDYISGDFSARNSVNSGRLEGRCMMHQGKPWDLMAWSFTWTDGLYNTKTVPQLQREAAIVLALGGGFQAYFPQKRDGSVRLWQQTGLMSEVAKFCRARQTFCHQAQSVPQIALLYSTAAYYRLCRNVFAPWSGELNALNGILQSLLDAQNAVDIVSEHHLTGRMQEYPLIVIPEWEYLAPEFRDDLLSYVRNGGNLLLIGPRCAALFDQELAVKLAGNPAEKMAALHYHGWMAGLKTLVQQVELGGSAKPFGAMYDLGLGYAGVNDPEGASWTAASITPFGKGLIAATYLNLGERYLNNATPTARDFLNGLVRELFPNPLVEVAGSHTVDVVVTRKDGRLMVNLVNTAGPHSNKVVNVFDEIPALGPLSVAIRTEQKPRMVTVQPGAREAAWDYTNGKVRLTLPKLEIHDMIVVE